MRRALSRHHYRHPALWLNILYVILRRADKLIE